MSKFLGPIHYWLFNKIKHFEELESNVIKDIEEKLDINIQDTVAEIRSKHGYTLDDKPLEDLIDTTNIHGWLQSKINIAESRQAELITNLIEKHSDRAFDIIKDTYANQGSESGRNAKTQYEMSTAPDLYKALNNYILDGMPCDNANNVTINKPEFLQWKVVNCLHKKYWDNASGKAKVFYYLRKEWISEFVKNANEKFTYNFDVQEVDGQIILVHEIVEK